MKPVSNLTLLLGLPGAVHAGENYRELTECYKPVREVSYNPFNQGYRHPEYDIRCLHRWRFEGKVYDMLSKWNPGIEAWCTLVEGVPGLSYPNKIRVVTTTDFQAEVDDSTINKIITLMSETYTTVLEAYARLNIDVGPYIDLLLTTAPDTGAVMESGRDGCACVSFAGQLLIDYVRRGFENDTMAVRQSVAHEMYHCAQYYAQKDPIWWVFDGSADYFSNVIFPTGDYEWRMDNRTAEMYSPVLPIYDQHERRYAVNMFFQAMEMKGGSAYVHAFNMGLPPVRNTDFNPQAERNRLSKYPGFADDFFYFAKLYTIVKPSRSSDLSSGMVQTKIIDSCAAAGTCKHGQYRTIANIPETGPTPLGGSSPYLLQAVPFTVRHFSTKLDASLAGKTVSITSNAQGNQRIAFRLATTESWTEMPGTLEVPCIASGTSSPPIEILFLFTSTDDAATSDVEVTVGPATSQKEKRDGSSCETIPNTNTTTTLCGAASGPIDPCTADKTWILDNLSQQNFYNNISATKGGGVLVSGRQTFTIDAATGKFKLGYEDSIMTIFSSVLGLTIKSVSTTKGFHGGLLTTKSGEGGNGTICMVTTEASGTVSTIVDVNGYAEPATVTPLTAGEPVAGNVQYRCEGGTLTIGYMSGGAVNGLEVIYRDTVSV